jgi:hypothetical protein
VSDRIARWLAGLEDTRVTGNGQEVPPDILEELDALYEERVRRNDSRWFPPDSAGLSRLALERRARR